MAKFQPQLKFQPQSMQKFQSQLKFQPKSMHW
jgi:hypothetical protein